MTLTPQQALILLKTIESCPFAVFSGSGPNRIQKTVHPKLYIPSAEEVVECIEILRTVIGDEK